MKESKKVRRVEVDWEDSIAWKGWELLEEVVKDYDFHGLNQQKTIGYLIQDRKGFITVAQSLSFNNQDKQCYRGADFISIPKGCIKKITKL